MGDHRYLHVLTPSFLTRRSSDLLSGTRIPAMVSDIGSTPLRDEAPPWRGSTRGSTLSLRVSGDRTGRGGKGTEPAAISAILSGGSRPDAATPPGPRIRRSEEHTSELQSLMRNSYAVSCMK